MKYLNPIIKGFHPDPSICRVGEDYYLVTSSFEYVPGIPIFHSTDLVNWEQIGNCIVDLDGFDYSDAGDSGGIFAPTIRFHNGRFYVTSTLICHGNFIISTDNLYTGKWTKPVPVAMDGIDPSIYFDGDRAYYTTNMTVEGANERISLAEIDITTGKLKGAIKGIWEGSGGGYIEGPHLYKINDYYYLLAAEGGTEFNHMSTIARSKDIWGDYESSPNNPILNNRNNNGTDVFCTGHADMFEDQDGNWWLVHLGIRLGRRMMSNLGRETFLTSIKWDDNGWPIPANATIHADGPLWQKQQSSPPFQTSFKNNIWEHDWLFLRNVQMENYDRSHGSLILTPSSVDFAKGVTPTFVGVRQPDFDSHFITTFSFEPMEINDRAGLIVYLSSDFNYRLFKEKKADGNYLTLEKRAEDFFQIPYSAKIPDGDLKIEIESDKLFYYFYATISNEKRQFLCKASTRFLSVEVSGNSFVGTVIGLFTKCETDTNAKMVIHDFSVSAENNLTIK